MTQTRNYPLTFDLRRPDASGEFRLYQPRTIGDVDELARLALGATLVLPVNAEPAPPRHAVPTVYMPAPEQAEVFDPFAGWSAHEVETQPVIDLAAVMPQPEPEVRKPLFGRGTHRPPPRVALSPGAWMLTGAGLLVLVVAVVAAVSVVAIRVSGAVL